MAGEGPGRPDRDWQEQKTMKTRNRFIRSVINTAKSCDTPMPWARGGRRAGFALRRRGSARQAACRSA